MITREHVEEMLELLWTAEEDGLTPLDCRHLPEQLQCFLPSPLEANGSDQAAVIDSMVRDSLVEAEGSRIRLSSAGKIPAAEVVRRHRLTEVLLHNVLEVSEESMESTACQVEHLLNPEVTDAVCTFLGHPPSCPHGRLIPRGACCAASAPTLEPLIVPLAQVEVGEEVKVAFVHSKRHDYLQRMNAFGVAPGRRIRLRQTHPALVIQVGETDLALDTQAGREIFVRRRPRVPTPSF